MKNIILFILLFFIYFTMSSQKIERIKYGESFITIENLLQKYIQIPSVSGNEKEAGEFIKKICKENGLHITNFGTTNGTYNFAASIYPLDKGKPNIVLLNHIDVVPENSNSLKGVFSGKIEDGNIYGRGAIDNKGAAVMQLFSIVQFINRIELKNSKYNVTFLAASGEETQSEGGIQYVIENYFDLLKPVVVIGEGPSELTTLIGSEFKHPIFGISVAHKRSYWLNLELAINTAGHGSVTPINYANKELIASLNKLTTKKSKVIFNDLNISLLKAFAEHKKGFEKLILKHPKLFKPILTSQLRKQPELFAIFSNTITLTNVYSNSEVYNKIASKAGAYLDCRLLPETNADDFLQLIKKRLNNDNIKITIVQQMPETKPSMINNLFYKNLSNAIIDKFPDASTLPLMMPIANDLGAFRSKNIPAYASIPVYLTREQVESIHGKDENISIKCLYTGAEIYYNFLLKTETMNNLKNDATKDIAEMNSP